MLGNSFGVQTMLGLTDAVGHIDSWTFADMMALIEATDTTEMPYIMGEWMTREGFLQTALAFSGDLINWTALEANLDSEAFIQLLEIASRLRPSEEGGEHGGEWFHPVGRMMRGEQLIAMQHIWGANSYQEFVSALEDVTVLGMPSEEGGAHIVHLSDGIGINAASDLQEEAWEFARRFFLPSAEVNWNFPLRIDLYEAMIAEAMIPRLDAEGEEVMHDMVWIDQDTQIPLYALSAEEAAGLREIVESASLMFRFDESVWEMVQEEIAAFFAGDRSAADTARILQNRVQTLLREQR